MKYTDYPRGSEWRKWDLHIHTPISICQEYGGEQNWEQFIEALERLPKDVKVIGITDYYFIDGFAKVMESKTKGRLQNLDKIFPILEFRIDTFGSGNENNLQKINLHILFDLDEENLLKEIEKVNKEFIDLIPISSLDKHKTKMLSRENLIIEGGNNLQKGFSNLIPSTKKVFELAKTDTWKDKAFLLLGYKEWSNIEKNNQLKPLKEDLYDKVDAFLTSNIITLDKSQQWLNEYGDKRLLHSGDIHDFNLLDTANKNEKGEYISSKNYLCDTWIKADPTFEGLRQIIYEPEGRVKIQAIKPDSKNDRQIISEIQFKSSNKLFGNQTLLFNENLNAIIGGKSSGKSLLLHSMADSIDPEQVKKIETKLNFEGYSFAKEEYDFTVTWKNNEKDTLSDVNPDNKTRKITYIPQLYINYLAEKNNKEELNSLIGNILLQDNDYKLFFEVKTDQISVLSKNIENELNDLLVIRKNGIDLQEEIKRIGTSKAIESAIKNLEKQLADGQKRSNLSFEEVKQYNDLIKNKESLEKQLRLTQSKINILNEFSQALLQSKNNLVGIKNREDQIISKGQLDKLLTDFNEIPKDIRNIKELISKGFEVIIENLKTEILKLELNEEKAEIDKSIKKANTELTPFLKKIAGQKELEKLTNQLNKEKDRKRQSQLLETKFSNFVEEYRTLKEQITENLTTRYLLYKKIVSKINETRNEIGEEIILDCSLVYKKNRFLLFGQVNKAAISQDHYFNKLFSNDTVKYELIPGFFNKLKKVSDNHLDLSDKSPIPLKQKISINEIFKGMIIDNFEFDYNVTYKNDELLHMSPGKKGTVLLILFLQISSAEYPILIDQPEDNLDNRTIYDLLCTIVKEKKINRQIIIVSHNANLVVTTDSENIIVANQEGQDPLKEKSEYRFEYVTGSLEYSMKKNNDIKGVLYQQGIKEHVCDILEGGNEAFKKRERKYGFR